MALLSQTSIERLKDKADILDIVQQHVKMKRAGANWKGLCPFHDERSPSFTVQPAEQFFYCFGCMESGDVFDFVSKITGVTFREAVEELAEKNGVELEYEEESEEEKLVRGKRSRLLRIHEAAATYYHYRLLDTEGEEARAYLKKRGFGKEDATTFRIGYSPDAPDDLWNLLTGNGYERQDLLDSGLFVERDNGRIRDRFRARIMFPIETVTGDIVGFGARALPSNESGPFKVPKYLNSPETKIYHKTSVLFGLPQARKSIQQQDTALVVEGYTDVISLHKRGITNAVATCGTATTEGHVRTLTRMAKRIVVAFDPDQAGQKAARAAWEESRNFKVEVHALPLPAGFDPSDWVNLTPDEDVQEALAATVPAERYIIENIVSDYNIKDTFERSEALTKCLEFLSEIPDISIRVGLVENEIPAIVNMERAFVKAEAVSQGVTLSREAPKRAAKSSLNVDLSEARKQLERDVLWLIIMGADYLPDAWWDGEVKPEHFESPLTRNIFEAISEAGGAGIPYRYLEPKLKGEDETLELLRKITVSRGPQSPSERLGKDYINKLMMPLAQKEQHEALAALSENQNSETERLYHNAKKRVQKLRSQAD